MVPPAFLMTNDDAVETTGDAESSPKSIDPRPYEWVNPDATTPLLLVCDHASAVIPSELDDLGLAPADLHRHIAYDIGAADLTRRLARKLNCPAVLAGVSRLVIDCNRSPGDPQSILHVSDGVTIPGNTNLSESETLARANAYHWPYHAAISRALTRLRRRGPAPAFFSIHTFTPSLGGEDRFWDAGVLWNRDPRIAVPLIEALRAAGGGIAIGDNEPYSGREIAYTLTIHAAAAGLPHAAMEVRQDHCERIENLERWAALLARALEELLASSSLYRVRHF